MKSDARPQVIPLGTASALPDADHANAYLAVAAPSGSYWLVDCADSPIPRLMRAGMDPLDVEGLFITHFHPDHIYGLPAWWLGLRMLAHERDFVWRRSLMICARDEVLSQIRALARIFEPQGWLEDLPLVYHEVYPEVRVSVAQTDAFRITAAPTKHSLPSMAVRFDWRQGEEAFVYSGDTAPCRAVEILAAGASLLFHEATGHACRGAGCGTGHIRRACGSCARPEVLLLVERVTSFRSVFEVVL